MKGWKMLTALLLGSALVATAAPSAAAAKPYRHYTACGLTQHAKPSHSCPKRAKKGAFFRSNVGDVFYTVCVRFPTGRNLCAQHQQAERGTLYVNKITSNIPGKHRVTWFVRGKRVGLAIFRVKARGR